MMLEVDQAKPAVDISFDHAFCAVHGEPFRAKWPSGYLIAGVMLVDLCFRSDKVQAEIRRLSQKGPTDQLEPGSLLLALDRKPACCWIDEDELMQVYVSAKIGKVARCRNCNRKKPGTAFATHEKKYDHICFYCVIHRVARVN